MSHGKALVLLVFLVGQGWVFADKASARFDAVPGSRYTSARGAALGDAYLPLADDGASALFYNPAAIARLKDFHFEPMNIQLGVNSDYTNSLTYQDFFKAYSLQNFKDTLADHQGRFAEIGAQYAPMFYVRGFAFGMMYKSRLGAKHNGDTVEYRALYQFIPTAGFGVRLAKGIVRLGYSFQFVNQVSGSAEVDEAEANNYTDNLPSGGGFSHNAGLALTLPIRFLPSMNFVARNVGTVAFNRSALLVPKGGGGKLPNDPTSFDASLSLHPKIGAPSHISFVFGYRDITNTSSTHLFSRISMGVEFSIKNIVFLRGGIGSGYPSAGIGLRRPLGEFHLGWYSEDLGKDFQSTRNNRIIFQYQLRAF